MMLLPKILRQHNTNNKRKRNSVTINIVLSLLQNLSNRKKFAARAAATNDQGKPTIVAVTCTDICLQRAITLEVIRNESNCRHSNEKNIGIKQSSNYSSRSSSSSSCSTNIYQTQAKLCNENDKDLIYSCSACHNCSVVQHYSRIHFFRTFYYHTFFCQIFVNFILAVVSKLLKCIQYVALVCRFNDAATFLRQHVDIRQAKQLH